MTPPFPSWLGRGTSRRALPVMLFMGPGGGGPPWTRPGLSVVAASVAGLGEELEMDAAAMRNGRRAVVGFAAKCQWQSIHGCGV